LRSIRTWLGTLYGAGLALGAVIAAQLLTLTGPRDALAAACGATGLAWLLAAARSSTLRAGTGGRRAGQAEV
jgi:hypothetical protein